jgi:hypothetical protein
LKDCNFFLRVPLSNGIVRDEFYSDDQVRLLAWIAAEGHFFSHRNVKEKRGVGLVQSESHNPEYVAEIDALLDRLGGHYNRKSAVKKERGDTMICWQLRKQLWSFIGEALPEKRVSMDLLSRLTVPQMKIFLDTFAKGDGTFVKNGGYAISQKSIETLNTLQAMAVLTGNASTMWERQKDTANDRLRDYGTVYVAKSKRAYVKEFKRTRSVVDTVWCPETLTGTWIARRNGRTFVTGNSKANRPNWARGSIGATVFTFKQFSIAYIEFLKRLPAKERALALGLLILAAGMQGMPGADDLDDLIDMLAEQMGFSLNSKQAKRDFVAKLLGKDAAGYVMYGVSHGIPLDIAGRLSVGNLIPGTGIFKKSEQDESRDMKEIAGPIGSFATEILHAAKSGSGFDSIKSALPKAVQDGFKGYDMLVTGEAHDKRGRRVADVTKLDAAIRFIGFNPSVLAKGGRDRSIAFQNSSLLKVMQSEIYEKWAQGIAEGDAGKTAAARQELKEWNTNNPDSPIVPKMSSIQRRVNEIKRSADDRFIRSSPKQMRAQISQLLNAE